MTGQHMAQSRRRLEKLQDVAAAKTTTTTTTGIYGQPFGQNRLLDYTAQQNT